MTGYDEERIGELLSALPPAPEALVRSAHEIPLVRQPGLARIVERAEADDEYRRRVVADPQAALEEAEVVAHDLNVEILRRRLDT